MKPKFRALFDVALDLNLSHAGKSFVNACIFEATNSGVVETPLYEIAATYGIAPQGITRLLKEEAVLTYLLLDGVPPKRSVSVKALI